MLPVPLPELVALAEGEIVVAFAARGTVTEGDEVTLVPGPPLRPDEVKPAYRRWMASSPPEPVTAVVVAVDPASLLDVTAGGARHLRLTAPQDGDLLVLRVATGGEPVLSDGAFAARVRSVEGAMR